MHVPGSATQEAWLLACDDVSENLTNIGCRLYTNFFSASPRFNMSEFPEARKRGVARCLPVTVTAGRHGDWFCDGRVGVASLRVQLTGDTKSFLKKLTTRTIDVSRAAHDLRSWRVS